MIVFGGMIGVGFFMGVISIIKWIGLLVIFVYLIVGIFLFLIMRVMGEMIYLNFIIGLFVIFVSDYIYFVVGYMIVWSNIF